MIRIELIRLYRIILLLLTHAEYWICLPGGWLLKCCCICRLCILPLMRRKKFIKQCHVLVNFQIFSHTRNCFDDFSNDWFSSHKHGSNICLDTAYDALLFIPSERLDISTRQHYWLYCGPQQLRVITLCVHITLYTAGTRMKRKKNRITMLIDEILEFCLFVRQTQSLQLYFTLPIKKKQYHSVYTLRSGLFIHLLSMWTKLWNESRIAPRYAQTTSVQISLFLTNKYNLYRRFIVIWQTLIKHTLNMFGWNVRSMRFGLCKSCIN